MTEKKGKTRGESAAGRPQRKSAAGGRGDSATKGRARAGSAAPCHVPAPGTPPPADLKLLKRLSRVEGQVRGIARMVEEDRYCIDILTQMAAVHEALRATGRQILENHMKSCVARAMTSGKPEEADRVTEELGRLLTRMSR